MKTKRTRKRRDSQPKRAYLSRDKRRAHLLSVGADLVEHEGWAALTMSALAEHSGTSRQLIYQHFPNLEKLLADTALHIFMDTMKQTQASVAAHPASLAEAVTAAEAITLELPAGRGDALWQLIAGTAGASGELDQIRRRLRKLIGSIWTQPVRKHLHVNEADAQGYAWMMVMAFWGMRQLVRDGEIGRAQGVKLFNELVARIAR